MRYTKRKKKFFKICRDIKEVKIQGARAIARAALDAYKIFPTEHSKKILISLRPTEPMLQNVLKMVGKKPISEIMEHFDSAQKSINKYVMKILKQGMVIFTYCHSTNVVNALIYAKKHGKKFEVYNTETRPLYQGRKTARELAKAGINVTNFVDAATAIALEKTQKTKKVDIVLLGADAILKNGAVINKVGSGMIAELAALHRIPLYIIADSWKFSPRNVKIEEREHKEVWKRAPSYVKIRNPAFEIVKAKFITAIISELGILKPKEFVKKAKIKI